jgi:hypothetical protein
MKVKITFCLVLVGFASGTVASDGVVSGDVGYIYSGEQEGSYLETNLFYGLPWGVNGFTYVDLYNLGGYFGETSLDKPMWKGVGPKIHLQHVDEPFSNAGLGVSAVIPGLPEGIFLKVGLVPLWTNKYGSMKKTMAEYCFSVELPEKFVLSGFGNVDLVSKPTWGYGELEIARRIGKNVRIGYSASLCSKGHGKATPDLEHRIALRIGF